MKEQNYTFKQLCNHPAFKEWARGQERPDAEKLEEWILESEENRKIAIRAQKKITGIRFIDPNLPDLEEEWAKVRKDIRKGRFEQNKRRIFKNRFQNRFWNYTLRIAATLILGSLVGVGVLLWEGSHSPITQESVTVETISTDYNDRQTLLMPDGSKIVLAANSTLSYKGNWLRKDVVRVSLSGEAYFSIVPKTNKRSTPKFVVETQDGLASVWGTQFTVNTHKKGTKVVLEEGEVRINPGAKTSPGDQNTFTMKPGQMADYSGDNEQIEVKEVNPKIYTSWVNNKLYFDETSFSVLVDRLERTYGLKVKVEDQQILDTKLSGTIDFTGLNQLIEAVEDVMEVTITKKDKTLVIT